MSKEATLGLKEIDRVINTRVNKSTTEQMASMRFAFELNQYVDKVYGFVEDKLLLSDRKLDHTTGMCKIKILGIECISDFYKEVFVPKNDIDINSELDIAQSIARRESVKPSTVYADNELYHELIKYTRDPKEIASLCAKAIKKITPEIFGELSYETGQYLVSLYKEALRLYTETYISKIWGENGLQKARSILNVENTREATK